MIASWRIPWENHRTTSEDVTLDIDNLAEEALEPTWFYFYKALKGPWMALKGPGVFWKMVVRPRKYDGLGDVLIAVATP